MDAKIYFDRIYIVGCGGVASYLLPALIKVVNDDCNITLIDGDTLEERNLDRQLFSPDLVGMNKAEAMAKMYPRTTANSDYFTNGFNLSGGKTVILGCADNHAARRAILETCDADDVTTVIGGNEFTDAEAYYYDPIWEGKPMDPRIYYPSILTDTTGDPTRPAGCAGLAQAVAPQLALANNSAADYMLQLLWFYEVEMPKLDAAETSPFWPVIHRSNFIKHSTVTVKMLQDKAKENAN